MNFKLALATTCVACTLDLWLKRLHAFLEASAAAKEEILDALPPLNKAVAYIGSTSTKVVEFAARSTALINEGRRAMWLKSWSGDTASKSKHCVCVISQ